MAQSVLLDALLDRPHVTTPKCGEAGCIHPCANRKFDRFYEYCEEHRLRPLSALWRLFFKNLLHQSHHGGVEENFLQNNFATDPVATIQQLVDAQVMPEQIVDNAQLLFQQHIEIRFADQPLLPEQAEGVVEPLLTLQRLTEVDFVLLNELGLG